MKIEVLIVTLIFIWGCTVNTQIIDPGGETYTIKSQSDAMVTMKSNNIEIVVDNRGKTNIFESLLGWLLLKTPEID